MTSEKTQIQTLIQQIDEVLSKTSPRLPWVMSSDAAQQRQVLEQARHCLAQVLNDATENQSLNPPPGNGQLSTVATAEVSAQQALQAVVQEMNLLRANMLQPLRSDMEMMRLQRDALVQEIRQLQAQQQAYRSPQYMTEFLQAAISQMQENLSGQMAQMFASLAAQPDPQQLTSTPSSSASSLSTLSQERLEHLQQIQSQSDQLLMRLDTTLRVVFESLQRNLQSYGDSLEEGLGRMHDMGQQGEAVFGAFVTRLAQMLGREASSFMQSSQTSADRVDRPSLPNADHPNAHISRLLAELNALDQSGSQPVAGEPVPFEGMQPPELDPEEELSNLEQLDRALSQLDLSAVPSDLQVIREVDVSEEPEEPEDDAFPFPPLDEQVLNPDYPIAIEVSSIPMADTPLDEDLESVLDLLARATEGELSSDQQPEEADEGYQPLDETEAVSETLDTPSDPPSDSDQTPEQVEDLFAGLAESETDSLSDQVMPIELAADLPQSVEQLLLHPPAASPHLTVDDVFSEVDELPSESRSTPEEQRMGLTETDLDVAELRTESSTESSAEPEEAIETITALTDLIPVSERGDAPAQPEPGWTLADWSIAQDDQPSSPVDSDPQRSTADELLESTIEDWFAAVESEPVVTPEAPRTAIPDPQPTAPPAQSTETDDLFEWGGDQTDANANADAFTLMGVDSLFEGTRPSLSDTETQNITVEDVFGEVAPLTDSSLPDHPDPDSASSDSKKKA